MSQLLLLLKIEMPWRGADIRQGRKRVSEFEAEGMDTGEAEEPS